MGPGTRLICTRRMRLSFIVAVMVAYDWKLRVLLHLIDCLTKKVPQIIRYCACKILNIEIHFTTQH